MKTIKNGIKTEQMVDDSGERRYLLKIDWNKEKSRACVIMLSPGSMNGISYDRTTNFVLENLVRLDYGGVEIVNLFSNVDSKTEKYDDDVNMDIIDASAKRCDIVIFATGASYKTNKTNCVLSHIDILCEIDLPHKCTKIPSLLLMRLKLKQLT